MRWVLIDDLHINTNNLCAFYWSDGFLRLNFRGYDDRIRDPEQKLYKRLCHQLGVVPAQESECDG